MTKSISPDERERLLGELAAVLQQSRVLRKTMTYLQVADALAIEAPRRIHKTTRLLEILLKEDVIAGRAPRSALAVSKRHGRPAEGFFDRARRLGLFDGRDPEDFHDRLLLQLFDQPADPDRQ